MTRVMIAAQSAVTRAGLEALVGSNPGLELVGSFSDLGPVEVLRPDVILAAVPYDELAPALDDTAPAIVLLTAAQQPVWTRDALRLGVRAVLSSDASAAEVLAAVDAAASGLAVLDPRYLETLLSGSILTRLSAEPPVLTARELDVLRMMAEGAANKNIAWKLNISEHTVKFHVASILNKLNAGTRTEAVAIGMRKGMILL